MAPDRFHRVSHESDPDPLATMPPRFIASANKTTIAMLKQALRSSPKNEKVNQEVFELTARGLRGPGGCQSNAGVGGGHSGCLIHAA